MHHYDAASFENLTHYLLNWNWFSRSSQNILGQIFMLVMSEQHVSQLLKYGPFITEKNIFIEYNSQTFWNWDYVSLKYNKSKKLTH